MPFLLKKIEFSIVEQINSELSAVSNIQIEVGYGGSYFMVSNFFGITQNFDSVISSVDLGIFQYYGLKSKEYKEIKINF